MKINRRNFLSYGTALVLGGAAGSMLTPAPWKLMDDLAIWTQNWPWTPVPEDGPVSYKPSVCTLCPGGCGINVRLTGGRPVKIEGLRDYPVNNGSLCPMGFAGLQYLYNPARVISPLKREGKRGEGKWTPVSWDEAIAAVTQKLADLRAAGRPESVACITGSDHGAMDAFVSRFMTAYGSPNYIRSATAMDAMEQAIDLTQGQQGTPVFDIENADFILSFGAGLLEGWGSAGRMLDLFGNQKSAKKLIQIEPRLSDTAARATQWIAIHPGAEGALALGLAHVIIKESLYNKYFVDNFAFGFSDWVDETGRAREGFATWVKAYGPEKVSGLTGITPEKIMSLARDFAHAGNPIAISGRGNDDLPGSMDETLAIHFLNALVGNINKTGGVSALPETDYAKWPEINIDETASKGLQQARIDGAGGDEFPNTRFLINRLPGILLAAGESPIQALLVTDANPLYALADAENTKKAFDRIPFIVSFASFMDETAAFADYILPNHTHLERLQVVPATAGVARQIIGLAKPVVKPVYDTRHIGDTFINMAGALGGFVAQAFPWKNYEAFLTESMGNQWEELNQKGRIEIDHSLPDPMAFAFNTTSAKFEFYPTARSTERQAGDSALPTFTPVPIEGDPNRFKLTLIPYDAMRLAGGDIANVPFLTKILDDTVLKKQTGFVEINPATAKKLGFKEGDSAKLATPKGEAMVRVHLFEGIMPDVIAMPRGLGHTAYSDYLSGKGTNVNALMGSVEDPTSGLDMAWGIRASLTRA